MYSEIVTGLVFWVLISPAWGIAGGRGPMPAWKGRLIERKIRDVVSYLRVLAGAARKE